MLKDLFGFNYLKSLKEVGPENTSKTIRALKSLKFLKEKGYYFLNFVAEQIRGEFEVLLDD